MAQVVILTFTPEQKQIRYLGPYQISWWIKENGYTTQVLDYLYCMTKEQRINLYNKYITKETKIIGYAPLLLNSPSGTKTDFISIVIDEVNELFPWIKIVAGGPLSRQILLENAASRFKTKIDAVFEGEAENSFLEYCNYIFRGEPHPKFTIQNGQKVITSFKKYNIQMCRMRFSKNDFILPGESLPLELGRGCIFKCKFCQFANIGKDKDDFNRSMENIRDSLISNYEQFGTTDYQLSDDTLNSHRERTKQFHKMSKELPFKLNYVGFVRIDLLDIWPEQIELLPDSGMTSTWLGIESLDPVSCKIIGKGWGGKNHKPFLEKLVREWRNDVIIGCGLIAGLGYETEQHWEDTDAWFSQSGIHDWTFQPLHILKTLGMSEFEKNYKKYGYEFIIIDGKESDYMWKNNVTTFSNARNWCAQKRMSILKKSIPSAWYYSFLRNLNFSREEILKSNYVTLDRKILIQGRTRKFTDEYYKLAINY